MKSIPLALGSDVIQRMIPHRRPFVFVDAIESYAREPRPTLKAMRLISANEPVFEGHFPGLHLWPGVYTIEGLGQTSNLLQIIHTMETQWTERGGQPDEVLAALRNLELGYRLQPGYQPELTRTLEDFLATSTMSRGGFSASVEVKLHAPVFAGQRLDYEVSRTRAVDQLVRFEVLATVDGKRVASGVMTGSQEFPLPPGMRSA